MSTGEAWDLTKEVMGAILKDLTMARGVVVGIRENSPGFHIRGALKAHEVMQCYQDAQFQDDPALSGVLKRRTDIDGNNKLVSKLGNVTEKLPNDAATSLGKEVTITTYVDANLSHDWTTGRAVTGTLDFLNGTPIDWFSKRQNTVETATYGSEFDTFPRGIRTS